MKNDIIKSSLIAGVIAIILGIGNTVLSLYIDWKSRSKNPELFDKLVDSDIMPMVFSWSRIVIYVLKIFVGIFVILFIYYTIKNRKKKIKKSEKGTKSYRGLREAK